MLGMARSLNARIGSFYWLAALLEGIALRRTDGVLCNSSYTEQLVRKRTTRSMWRVPNALRSIFFEPETSRPLNEIPLLLNVGLVAPHKRQIEILQIAQSLFERDCRFHLRFVGDVNEKSEYGANFHRLISRAETSGFASHTTTRDVSALVRHFDQANALIHCPKEEAFGLVVAEGLARNLNLFAARIGGIPDIAAGTELAELLDPDDWEGLYSSIVEWMDKGCPRPLSAATEMRRRYHPTVIAQHHLEIYQELLSLKH